MCVYRPGIPGWCHNRLEALQIKVHYHGSKWIADRHGIGEVSARYVTLWFAGARYGQPRVALLIWRQWIIDSVLTVGVSVIYDRLRAGLRVSLCARMFSLGSRTGKVAVGAAAVPSSRQLDEENIERTETLCGRTAQSAAAQSAFPVAHTRMTMSDY